MQRRTFLATSSLAPLARAAEPEQPKNAFYHLVYYYMRNGTQVERTTQYLQKAWMPAAERAGIGPMGFFSPVLGDRAPFILSLATYPSFSAIEALQQKLAGDQEFQKGWDAYNTSEPAYVRMESAMLRAFDGWPAPQVPPVTPQRALRIFELRTYESISEKAGRRKIKMFDDGEAAIFKRLGMSPVFFGQTVIGQNLPNLTYLLAFDDLAARDRLWRDFGSDAEWRKLRAQPGLSDAEIVSSISNSILRPLPFSPIR
jgi:hypothetical protein